MKKNFLLIPLVSISLLSTGCSVDNFVSIHDFENFLQINDDLSGTYKLSKSITIDSDSDNPWIPIGTKENPFTGEFNGAGYTITLNIKNKVLIDEYGYEFCENELDYFGIFGYVSSTAYIHNLNIVGKVGDFKNKFFIDCYGAVAAYSSAKIEKVNVDVSAYLTSSDREQILVGGFVGKNANGSFIDCSYKEQTIDVETYDTSVLSLGGIAGYSEGGEIKHCSTACDLNGMGWEYSYVGGMIGTGNIDNFTRISWKKDPAKTNPVTGTMSARARKDTGVCGEEIDNCVIGKKMFCEQTVVGSKGDLIDKDYYYAVTISSDKQWNVMCWIRYLNNNKWDYSNSKNQIIYECLK